MHESTVFIYLDELKMIALAFAGAFVFKSHLKCQKKTRETTRSQFFFFYQKPFGKCWWENCRIIVHARPKQRGKTGLAWSLLLMWWWWSANSSCSVGNLKGNLSPVLQFTGFSLRVFIKMKRGENIITCPAASIVSVILAVLVNSAMND